MSDYSSTQLFIINQIHEKKRNKNLLRLAVFGIWLVVFSVDLYIVFLEDFAFFRSKSPQVVSIDMLSPSLVEEYPYIQLTDMCFTEEMYWLKEDGKETYFYHASTCDSSKYEYNTVIFMLRTEMEELDTSNLDYELFSGKMSKGLNISSVVDGKIKREWKLDEYLENVYTFEAGYHPEDEKSDDLFVIGFSCLLGLGFTAAMFQLNRNYTNQIAVWKDNYYRSFGEHPPI